MAPNIHITVSLTPKTRLKHALLFEEEIKDPTSIKQLTITGVITEIYFDFLHENMGKTLQLT